MLAWEMRLKVRRYACEGKLAFYRDRHGDVVLERNRCAPYGDAWKKKSEKLAMLKMWISRELAEIEHIKVMANCGPIVGNRMVLHVRDGITHKVRPGPSIKDLIQRKSDYYKEQAGDGTPEDYELGVHKGLELALEILYNPYKYLDADERAAYDKAEEDEDRIIAKRAMNENGGPAVTLTAVKRGASDENIVTRRR